MGKNLIGVTIGLDYDGTFTADPDMWLTLVNLMLRRGHRVMVVTMRTPEEVVGTLGFETMDPRLIDLVGNRNVIPTSRKAKQPYMVEHGYSVSIWIDDNPYFVISDASS